MVIPTYFPSPRLSEKQPKATGVFCAASAAPKDKSSRRTHCGAPFSCTKRHFPPCLFRRGAKNAPKYFVCEWFCRKNNSRARWNLFCTPSLYTIVYSLSIYFAQKLFFPQFYCMTSPCQFYQKPLPPQIPRKKLRAEPGSVIMVYRTFFQGRSGNNEEIRKNHHRVTGRCRHAHGQHACFCK